MGDSSSSGNGSAHPFPQAPPNPYINGNTNSGFGMPPGTASSAHTGHPPGAAFGAPAPPRAAFGAPAFSALNNAHAAASPASSPFPPHGAAPAFGHQPAFGYVSGPPAARTEAPPSVNGASAFGFPPAASAPPPPQPTTKPPQPLFGFPPAASAPPPPQPTTKPPQPLFGSATKAGPSPVVTAVRTLPFGNGNKSFWVSWSGFTDDLIKVAGYEIKCDDITTGKSTAHRYDKATFPFGGTLPTLVSVGDGSHEYKFRVRAKDVHGNTTAWVSSPSVTTPAGTASHSAAPAFGHQPAFGSFSAARTDAPSVNGAPAFGFAPAASAPPPPQPTTKPPQPLFGSAAKAGPSPVVNAAVWNSPCYGNYSFWVSWSGFTDDLIKVAGYEIKCDDITTGKSTAHRYDKATFPFGGTLVPVGDGSHEYKFRVRAKDVHGNTTAWVSSPSVTATSSSTAMPGASSVSGSSAQAAAEAGSGSSAAGSTGAASTGGDASRGRATRASASAGPTLSTAVAELALVMDKASATRQDLEALGKLPEGLTLALAELQQDLQPPGLVPKVPEVSHATAGLCWSLQACCQASKALEAEVSAIRSSLKATPVTENENGQEAREDQDGHEGEEEREKKEKDEADIGEETLQDRAASRDDLRARLAAHLRDALKMARMRIKVDLQTTQGADDPAEAAEVCTVDDIEHHHDGNDADEGKTVDGKSGNSCSNTKSTDDLESTLRCLAEWYRQSAARCELALKSSLAVLDDDKDDTTGVAEPFSATTEAAASSGETSQQDEESYAGLKDPFFEHEGNLERLLSKSRDAKEAVDAQQQSERNIIVGLTESTDEALQKFRLLLDKLLRCCSELRRLLGHRRQQRHSPVEEEPELLQGLIC